MPYSIRSYLLAGLVLALWATPVATAQPLSPVNSADPVELRAFREYLTVSALAPGTEVLQAQVPCRGQLCLQIGVVGLSRDRLFSRLSGLVTGFGYGADVEAFSLSSSQADFDAAVFQLTMPVGAPRLDAKALAGRAQHLLKVLRTIAALSAPGNKATNPGEVQPGSKTFLMTHLSWQGAGKEGTIRLAAPPGSPRPELPAEPSSCPRWTLSPAPTATAGPFTGWLLYDLSFQFDCSPAEGPVK